MDPIDIVKAPRKRIASEVKSELARADVTPSDMGRITGQGQQYWSRRTTAVVPFSSDDLAVLSFVLGVPMSRFVPDYTPDRVAMAKAVENGHLQKLPDLDSNQEPIDFTPGASKYIGLRRPVRDELADHRRAKQDAHDAVEYRPAS